MLLPSLGLYGPTPCILSDAVSAGAYPLPFWVIMWISTGPTVSVVFTSAHHPIGQLVDLSISFIYSVICSAALHDFTHSCISFIHSFVHSSIHVQALNFLLHLHPVLHTFQGPAKPSDAAANTMIGSVKHEVNKCETYIHMIKLEEEAHACTSNELATAQPCKKWMSPCNTAMRSSRLWPSIGPM